jgi:hypothetical protein
MIESICSKVQILNNAVHRYYTLKFVIHIYVLFSPLKHYISLKIISSFLSLKMAAFHCSFPSQVGIGAQHGMLSVQFSLSEVKQHSKYTAANFVQP